MLVHAYRDDGVKFCQRIAHRGGLALTTKLLGDRHLDAMHQHRHAQQSVHVTGQRQPVGLDQHVNVVACVERLTERECLLGLLDRGHSELALLAVAIDVLGHLDKFERKRRELRDITLVSRREQQSGSGGEI